MDTKLIDSRGQITSAPSKKNTGKPVVVRLLGKNPTNIKIDPVFFNRVFFTEEIDKTGFLRYNKDGDIVQEGDYVFIRFLDLPYSELDDIEKTAEKIMEIKKDNTREIIKKQIPVALQEMIKQSSTFLDPYSLKLGTAKFAVPPVSIKVDKINTGERVPLLRTGGSLKKNAGRSDTRVQLTMFFSGRESIDDDDNGLRALIAMFKKTPFVPVKNMYLNYVHGIDAVCLHDLSVSTIPGLPNTVSATLVLFKFEYSVFMPNALGFDVDETLFKWHYKRNLTVGNDPLLKPISGHLTKSLNFKYVPNEVVQKTQMYKHRAEKSNISVQARKNYDLFSSAKRDRELINKVKELFVEMQRDKELDFIQLDRIVAIKDTYAGTGPVGSGISGASFKILFVVTFENKFNYGEENPFSKTDPPDFIKSMKHKENSCCLIVDKKTNQFTAQSTKLMNKVEETYQEAKFQQKKTQAALERAVASASVFKKNMIEWPGLEDIVITNVQLSKKNNFSRTPVLSQESASYQFLGSQDTYILMNLEVLSDESAKSLRQLFSYCNSQARTYSYNMVSGFLEIDNDLINLFGVNHVLIDSMSFETVPNFPGRYKVDLVLVDFNVVQSFCEQGYEIAKEGDIYVFRTPSDKVTREIIPGNASADLITRDMVYECEQVTRLLKYVDLYPDLDLPTYEEVRGELGIELPNPHKSVFVDPDFYIKDSFSTYKMLEETIVNGADLNMRDFFGNELSKRFSKGVATIEEKQVDEDALKKLSENYMAPKENFIAIDSSEKQELVRIIKEQVAKVNQSHHVTIIENEMPEWVAFSLVHLKSGMRLYDPNEDLSKRSYIDLRNPNRKLYNEGGYYGPMFIHEEFFEKANRNGINEEWIYFQICPDRFSIGELKRDGAKNVKFGLQLLSYKHTQDRMNADSLLSVMPKLEKNIYIARLKEFLTEEEFLWAISLLRYMENPYPVREKKISLPNEELLAKSVFEAILIGKYIYAQEDYSNLREEERYYIEQIDREMKAKGEGFSSGPLSEDPPFSKKLKSDGNEWYDSMMYSKKGSMLRAFPTFQVLLIDEGKWIYWGKMWDNFYGINAVSQFSVNRSRKRAADTCSIVMSNMYSGFENRDRSADQSESDLKINLIQLIRPTVKDKEMEKGRSYSFGTIKLSTGCRIHVRAGYGNNLRELPILFNGTVTEISVGDVVQVLAQGDGIELTNVLRYKEGQVVGHLGLGTEPQNLLQNLMLGEERHRAMPTFSKPGQSRFFGGKNSSPIVHFGDPSFRGSKEKAGEIAQNIYPGNGTGVPEWENLISWLSEDELNLQIEMSQKSVWDIAQIAAAAVPNYILAVHPFDFRSTLFYGKPHWDIKYGYEVIKPTEGIPLSEGWKMYGNYFIKEKSKPFAQWHIYTSFEDIISNQIKASSEGMYTNVVATYEYDPIASGKETRTGEVIAYADRSIDPQAQRTTVIDSEIYSKAPLHFLRNAPAIGWLTGWIPGVLGWPHRMLVDEHIVRNIAVANVVDYLKDMYKGNLLVLGDATVKPFDFMYIGDLANDMLGTCMVKEVTHYMSIDGGFVTSIQPDCCVGTDNKETSSAWLLGAAIGSALFSKTVAAQIAVSAGKATSAIYAGMALLKTSAAAAGTEVALVGIGTTAAAAASSPVVAVIVGAIAICIVAKSIDEILYRVLAQPQSVVINLLTYQGREFSAGINGHNGITIGTSGLSNESFVKWKALLPDGIVGELDPRDPSLIFGHYEQDFHDPTLYGEYLIEKYGVDINAEKAKGEEYSEELERIGTALQSVNPGTVPWTALQDIGQSIEGYKPGSYLSTLDYIKNVFEKHYGYTLPHKTIEELYADRDLFVNANPAKEFQVGIGNRAAKATFFNTYTIPRDAQIGDLVFFDLFGKDSPSFVGIITHISGGNFDFIAAVPSGEKDKQGIKGEVKIFNSDDPPFKKNVFGVTRPIETKLIK